MKPGQRFFGFRKVFVLLPAVFFAANLSAEDPVIRRGERFEIAEGKLSLILPDGWKKTELNASDVIAGYATQDNRTSAFIRKMDPSGGGMTDIHDATIANYEQTFEVHELSEVKTGDVPGKSRKWPAIFSTIEATVKKGDESFEMRFYLFIFDTGSDLYQVQASTTLPARESREKQIFEFLRSLVANS